jgi:UDP-glucose 4-epimerase
VRPKVLSKIVVFGGSGFIGSHVADQLSLVGHDVVIYDVFESPYLRVDQSMIIGDLLDPVSVASAVKGAQAVFNFAAVADINEALRDPVATVKINILGNVNILEACRLEHVDRIVYASSVYVNSREGGFYGCSKKAAEQYIEQYKRTYGLDFTILRYGSLYGPRSDSRNGLKRIIGDAVKNGILRYEGDKNAFREYIHVRDAAIASAKALDENFRNKKIILTGHQPIRVIDILSMLAEIMGLPSSAVQFSQSDYEGHYIRTPYHYEPDLAEKYIPETYIDLGEGLLEIIKSCKDSK